MSRENVEAIRQMARAYVRGDYRTSTEMLDPGVELWADPHTFPEAGSAQGRDAVVSWLADFISSFDDYWASEPDELIDAGDWVIAVARSGGRGRASGAPVDQVWTMAYKLREGKVVRFEFHRDKAQAMKAVGAGEPQTR